MTEDKPQPTDQTVALSSSELNAMQQIFNRFMQRSTPFGFQRQGEETVFHPLPYKPEKDDELLLKEPWRIILELHADGARVRLGMDLYGDVILGRGESQLGRIIVDLEQYNAQKLGVSREHLLLRPTKKRLYAIDQGSTNHSAINSVPSGQGVATELKNHDMISLGNMVFELRVIKKPD